MESTRLILAIALAGLAGAWVGSGCADDGGRVDFVERIGKLTVAPDDVTWPGTIPTGKSCDAQMMNIDFFPTFLAMTGVDPPKDRIIDGKNLIPLLTGESVESPHEELFYVMNVSAYAVRYRDHFKYYASTTSDNAFYLGMGTLHPFLFDLNVDPNESYDQRAHYPDRAKRMRDQLYAFNREIEINPRGWLE